MNCIDAGNVLVHLFLQTKTQYVLTNKKLQYLLIIAQMSQAACGRMLFEDDIRNFKNGFVLDAIGNSFMSGPDIVSGKANDISLQYDMDMFVLPYSNKKIFAISQMPSPNERSLLIKVFLAFGAYHENTLCKLLNEFRMLRNIQPYSVVPPELIGRFFSAAIDANKYVANPVFQFVREHKDSTCETKKGNSPKVQTPPAVMPLQADSTTAKTEQTTPSEDVPEPKNMAEPSGLPPQPLQQVQKTQIIPPIPRVLSSKVSLQNINVGKQYSVLVEVSAPNVDCEVTIVATDTNRRLPTVRNMVTDTIFSFTFEAVASDIKVSVQILP